MRFDSSIDRSPHPDFSYPLSTILFHTILTSTSSSLYFHLIRQPINFNFKHSSIIEIRIFQSWISIAPQLRNFKHRINSSPSVTIERKTHLLLEIPLSQNQTSFPRRGEKGDSKGEEGFLRHTVVSFSHVQRSSQARSGSTCPALNGHSHSHLCPRPRHSLAHCNDP